MTIAIMQPYLFPYIGYFQLIQAVDRFVVLDDVNFIKRGWVNRNNLLQAGEPSLFTVPLSGASQNRKISEILVSDEGDWRLKLHKRIVSCYVKAPMFGAVAPLVEKCLDRKGVPIGQMNREAIIDVMGYLGMETEVVPSSSNYGNADMKGQDRILDICARENASHYINPIGGVELYDRATFTAKGMRLSFLRANVAEYPQFGGTFVPGLSMIDVLMFNGPKEVMSMLRQGKLE